MQLRNLPERFKPFMPSTDLTAVSPECALVARQSVNTVAAEASCDIDIRAVRALIGMRFREGS